MAGNGAELRDNSIGDLLRQLSEETSTLVKQELALARAELEQQGKRAGTGAGMLGGAGVAGLLMLGALTATLIGVLDTGMAFWLAALIATVVWGAVAGVLALQGKSKIQQATPPAPQTVDTIKEDVQWAKTRT
ncbi:MAG TPA: phage holin family protein [Baekduia sp.]